MVGVAEKTPVPENGPSAPSDQGTVVVGCAGYYMYAIPL